MRIAQFQSFLERALPLKKRILAVGEPGIGKSYAWMAAARHLGYEMLATSAPLEDPSTVRGYPYRNNGTAGHALFGLIAAAFAATKPTVLFFDDLGMASESTMRAVLRLVQFGEVDDKRLPDCVVIGAATNDVGGGTSVIGMIEPLKSRWDSIVNVETHVDDVVAYLMAAGCDWRVCSFLRNSPEAVMDYKPTKFIRVDGACPRGWEAASGWVAAGVEDQEVLAGCVGKGRAAELLAWLAIANQLPDIQGCILNPDTEVVPTNPSAQFMVSCALAQKVADDGRVFGRALKYLHRLPQSMRAFAVKDADRAVAIRKADGRLSKDYRPFQTQPDFAAWSASKDGQEILADIIG